MSTIYNTPQSSSTSTLLNKGESRQSGAVFFATEVVIILPHTDDNLHKQLLVHPEAVPKLQRSIIALSAK
jgi:hypothetical protein